MRREERNRLLTGLRMLQPFRRPAERCARSNLATKRVGDRIAALLAERPLADFDAGRRLPALVFRRVEHFPDPADRPDLVAAADDLRSAHILFDQTVQNIVEIFVGRQRILVLLVGPQFRPRAAS